MTELPRVLIVDDEPFNVDILEQRLEPLGYQLISATDGKQALDQLSADFPGIVVTDVRMPRMDGLELMRRSRELDAELPVILVTAHGDVATAVQAMRDGAHDFIEKPVDAERLIDIVGRAMKVRLLVLENRALRADLLAKQGIEARLLGNSPLMEQLRANITNLADTGANVLVRGETGTGKELLARCLHDFSRRRDKHFVAVNCGAMPESMLESELFGHEAGAFTGAIKRRIGKFEHATGGTLFLDEIESMPLVMQVKLLRVLEEREVERLGSNDIVPVDFRLVAATQGDLSQACAEGAFRQDLYFRLNVATVEIPPLRDRREDVHLLFEYFLRHLSALHERDVPALERDDLHRLVAHAWPGNVRELRNVAERYVLGLGRPQVGIDALIEPGGAAPLTLAEQVEAFEKCLIEQSLTGNTGNIQAAVDDLGTPRRTLNQKMRNHGLDRKDFL
jgi:two-component system C4-dicarboxylate transport response regulator DctD